MGPNWIRMGYLWYNVVGCLVVVLLSILIQNLGAKKITSF